MRHFKSILTLSYFLILLSSCNQNYEINGSSSIKSLDGQMLYMKILHDGEWTKIDSSEIVHGSFKMNGHVDSTMMATLYMGTEAVMPVVLEKGKINIVIKDDHLHVDGTPLNNALYTFIDKRNSFEQKLEDIDRSEARMIMNGGDIDEIQATLNKESDDLFREMNLYIKNFISGNYDNVLGPNVFLMLCSTLPYPIMTPQIDDIINDAPYSFRSNDLVKDFLSKARQNMELIDEYQRMQLNPSIDNR